MTMLVTNKFLDNIWQNKMLIAVLILIISGTLCILRLVKSHQATLEMLPVAHAAGKILDATYTNSREGLLLCGQRGVQLVELDFSWTSDDQLVCIHDWKSAWKNFFGGVEDQAPSLSEFYEKAKNANFTPLILDDLPNILEKYSSLRIVTDVKERNIEALSRIAEKIPDYNRRIIPQIYHPSEYQNVIEIGYKDIIWTLYRFPNDNFHVLRWVDRMPLFAVTMPLPRAMGQHGILGIWNLGIRLAAELDRKGIPSYVHTINSAEKAGILSMHYGVSGVYTDLLLPGWH